MNAKDVLGYASGAAGLLAGTIQRAAPLGEVPDNNIEETISDYSATPTNVGSYDELQNLMNTTSFLKTNYTKDDLLGLSSGEAAGQILLNGLQGGLQGAQFGSQFGATGVAGSLIGGAIGFAADAIAGAIARKKAEGKAQNFAQQFNYDADLANQDMVAKINNSAMNISKENTAKENLNISAFGGPLYINDIFTNGVRKIENGGTHEQSPLEGVPMGIAADGLQNLVEEGELIYNDYVFSARLKVPEASKALLGLSKKKDYTFAEAAETLQKESEERPNDPISKTTLDEMMGRLQETQETVKAKREMRRLRSAYNKLSPLDKMNLAMAMQQPQEEPVVYAKGGKLTHKHAENGPLNTFNFYDPENTYAQIAEITPGIEVDANGQPVYDITGDWVYERPTDIGTGNGIIKRKDANGRTQYAILNRDPLDYGSALQYRPIYDKDGKEIGGDYEIIPRRAPQDIIIDNKRANFADALRSASVFGSLAGAIGSLFDKPNYSDVERAERAMASVPKVSAGHVGQRLTYNPVDINYLMTQTANQGIGARRALVESGAGPQAILGSNYTTQTAMGQNLLAALAQNAAREGQVAEFNRGTDTTNVGNDLQAALANQRRDMMGANFLLETAPIRMNERGTIQNNRSLQWTNAMNQFSNLGQDMYAKAQAGAMAASYPVTYNTGNLDLLKLLDPKALTQYIAAQQETQRTSKFGGKLSTKKGGKHA